MSRRLQPGSPAARGRALAALLAGALLAPGSPAAADVEVRAAGEKVSIDVHATPLPDVLNKVAAVSGMKVVYEAGARRPRVSVTITDAFPAQAVPRLLDGLGLNYVIQFAPDGKRVSTLIIASDGTSGAPDAKSPFARAAAESSEMLLERPLPEEALDAEEPAPSEAPPMALAPPGARPNPFQPAGPAASPPDPSPGPAAGPSFNGAEPLLPPGMRRRAPADTPPPVSSPQ